MRSPGTHVVHQNDNMYHTDIKYFPHGISETCHECTERVNWDFKVMVCS